MIDKTIRAIIAHKKNVSVLVTNLLIAYLLTACGSDSKPTDMPLSDKLTVTDFSGRLVSLDRPAGKIVALAPYIVENVFSAGAGEVLVGVSTYSHYPQQARNIEVVSGYEKTNFERIVALDPDLIIVWQSGNPQSTVNRLVELGFPVYIDQPDALQDVAKSIRDIGVLTGHRDKADLVAKDYLAKLAKFANRYRDATKVSTFYQVWNKPLQTISGNHSISHAIELCGGRNIYADEFAIAPIINLESILQRDPSTIIASGDGQTAWLEDWRQWPMLTAVKNNNLFQVSPGHIQGHTVRLLLGIDEICQQLDLVRMRSKAQ